MNIYDEIDKCIKNLEQEYKKNLPIVLSKMLVITEKLNCPYDWLWVKLQTKELKGNYEPKIKEKFIQLCKNIGLCDEKRIDEKYMEITRDFIKYRTYKVGKDSMYSDSVTNLISAMESLEQNISSMSLPENLSPIDLYYEKQKQDKLILSLRHDLSNCKVIINHVYTRSIEILTRLKYSQQEIYPHSSAEAISKIEYIFNNFHSIAQQLLIRHSSRSTITINDEYDVQDLLHALFLTFFKDIRAEEAVPNHAGANSRLDFLIPDYEIGIEVKMTRDGLKDKQIGDELLVDIGRYKSHPKCRNFLCFIYDPNYYINNFQGLKADLESHTSDNFNIKVYISR